MYLWKSIGRRILVWLQIGVLSGITCLGFIITLSIIKYRQINNQDPLIKHIQHRQKQLKKQYGYKRKAYEKRFAFYSRLPVIRRFIHRVFIRFSFIGERDKGLLIKQVIKVFEGMLVMDILLLSLFYQLTHNFVYSGIFIFFLWYIGGSYFDFFISSSHCKLLIQMKKYLSFVRQMYYEFNVIDDAIYEANLKMSKDEREMLVQGEKIYEILIASDPESEMNSYFEVAPNNFLKMFLSFAHMTMEYGDQKMEGRSVFLTNLDYLSKNIELEINKRKQLNYALKSINFIVMIPLFLISMIKNWAVINFAPLSVFYNSTAGKYTEIITILIILMSMVIINNIQNLDPRVYVVSRYTNILFRIPIRISVEQKKKWILFMGGILIAIGVFTSINISGRYQLRELVYYESNFLGASFSEKEIEVRQKESQEDFSFIKESQANISREEVVLYLETLGVRKDDERVQRVLDKILMYHSMYFKWWQVIVVFMVGLLGYFFPEISKEMYFRMRKIDIEDEIAGYRGMIMMLIYHPRMSVYEIIEWMEKYSAFYKQELDQCLQNMSQGEDIALIRLNEMVEHEEMKKVIHQLLLVTEGLTLQEAFDELLAEKVTFYEQRKWLNKRLISKKILIGQTVGFLPMYSLIILYLIVPMVVSSARELDRFFQQLF